MLNRFCTKMYLNEQHTVSIHCKIKQLHYAVNTNLLDENSVLKALPVILTSKSLLIYSISSVGLKFILAGASYTIYPQRLY